MNLCHAKTSLSPISSAPLSGNGPCFIPFRRAWPLCWILEASLIERERKQTKEQEPGPCRDLFRDLFRESDGKQNSSKSHRYRPGQWNAMNDQYIKKSSSLFEGFGVEVTNLTAGIIMRPKIFFSSETLELLFKDNSNFFQNNCVFYIK